MYGWRSSSAEMHAQATERTFDWRHERRSERCESAEFRSWAASNETGARRAPQDEVADGLAMFKAARRSRRMLSA